MSETLTNDDAAADPAPSAVPKRSRNRESKKGERGEQRSPPAIYGRQSMAKFENVQPTSKNNPGGFQLGQGSGAIPKTVQPTNTAFRRGPVQKCISGARSESGQHKYSRQPSFERRGNEKSNGSLTNDVNGNPLFRNASNRTACKQDGGIKHDPDLRLEKESFSKQNWKEEKRTLERRKNNSENNNNSSKDSASKSKTKKHIIDLKDLDRLLCKEPSVIILSLVAPCNGLHNLLTYEQLKPKIVIELLKVLARAFESTIHPENQHHLMAFLLASNLFAVHIPVTIASLYGRGIDQHVFDNIVDIFYALLKKMPTSAAIGLSDCLNVCIQFCPAAVKKSLFAIEAVMKDILNGENKKAAANLKGKIALEESDSETPDNFRELPIIPSVNELRSGEKPQFLRKNIVVGKYKSVHHYLDVQFRLLREDFVGPLREGIMNYALCNNKHSGNRSRKWKMQDIHIYGNVKIIEHECTTGGLVYTLRFNVKPLRGVNWETSSRLIYGSLLCLSTDNFNSVLFATVTNRDPKNLAKGFIEVKFEGEDYDPELSPKELSLTYVMIESPAYFEPFRHVLKGLQHCGNDIPFKNHIVYSHRHLSSPNYLHHNTVYDLSCALETNSGKSSPLQRTSINEKYLLRHGRTDYFQKLTGNKTQEATKHNHEQTSKANQSELNQEDIFYGSDSDESLVSVHQEVSWTTVTSSDIFNISTWPNSSDLGLDESQMRAMHLALTSSLAIIQGPPGTGKTYIGLKIVKVLLQNRSLWDTDELTEPIPILVVCYTNHALDQFLEGILPFTNKMVRIGSRSKSSLLTNHNIKNLRSKDRRSCYSTNDIRIELKSIAAEIQEVEAHIQCLRTHILHENALIELLAGEDKNCVLSLKNGFEDKFGVSPDDEQSPKSFLATWLGLTLEPFVKEADVEAFNIKKQDIVQAAGVLKTYQSTTLPEDPLFSSVQQDDDTFIKIDGAGAVEESNRILEDDVRETFTPVCPPDVRHDWVSIHVASLSDLQYYFPNETLDTNLAASYLEKCQIRKEIAERELRKTDHLLSTRVSPLTNMWTLPLEDRWRFYRRWVRLFHAVLICNKRELKNRYERMVRRRLEAINGENLAIMRQTDIVGMTTTGAAKYYTALQELGPKIVIVEEAAAVLESHVVTALSRRTQHLILIGDHQQLRPTTTVYKLSKDYHLDVSLFERMIKNGIHFETLQLQHRMRPEISRLLVPLFYKDVKDHQSVRMYKDIKGVNTNMFFINHNHNEENIADSMSHANKFEAEFLIGLCLYLIQQGYEREKITILTAYSGQQYAIHRLMRRDIFEGVHVTVVDNYQGEENDIILLSFVRSNEEGRIGFLGTANRVNVALSRAREALYCIGNFTLLANKREINKEQKGKSEFWPQLVEGLERDGKIGSKFVIVCQKHPNTLAQIESGKDFKRFAPEGGCLERCAELLECGHVCSRMCHPDSHKCREPCTRVCQQSHLCRLLCYQDCKPCNVPVKKDFVTCEHSAYIECHRDISEISCTTPVERVLRKCGHSALLECHLNPDVYNCIKKVPRNLKCGHTAILECYLDQCEHSCRESVERVLGCGHTAILECYVDPTKQKCKENVVHLFVNCQHQIEKACYIITQGLACPYTCDYHLQCGHRCLMDCHPLQDPEHTNVLCQAPCEKMCDMGHQCRKRCCEPCLDCDFVLVKKLLCGHTASVECRINVKDVICKKPCKRIMDCKHPCKQQCSKECGMCEVTIRQTLPMCGHFMRMKCMDNPSLKSCMEQCCRLLPCGHPCTYVCSAPCSEQCKHPIVRKGLCGHSLSIPCYAENTEYLWDHFCDNPCGKILPCGHECKGTCGDCRRGRVHVPCHEKCSRVQICGHRCKMLCYQNCPPCKQTCEIRCPHTRCLNKCGQACTKCKQPCSWNCSHHKCDKLCGEICTRPRCNEPCIKSLQCGHGCIGLCGEKCPKLCRICNKKELTATILFGFEYKEDALFIQLEYCGCCIDVRAMDYWMDKNENIIQLKGCPRCKTTVWLSQRYFNLINTNMLAVQKVRDKFLHESKNLYKTVEHLEQKLYQADAIRKQYPEIVRKIRRCLHKSFLQQCHLAVTENQITLLMVILKMKSCVDVMHREAKEYFSHDMNLLVRRFVQNDEQVTEYELYQITREIYRVYLQAATIDTKKLCGPVNGVKSFFVRGSTLSNAEISEIAGMLETAFPFRGSLEIDDLKKVKLLPIPNLTAGYWCKCSKGHMYSINSFKAKSEANVCNECKTGTDDPVVSHKNSRTNNQGSFFFGRRRHHYHRE